MIDMSKRKTTEDKMMNKKRREVIRTGMMYTRKLQNTVSFMGLQTCVS